MNQSVSQVLKTRVELKGEFYRLCAPLWETLFADLKADSEKLARELLIPLLTRNGRRCKRIIDIGCGTAYDLMALKKEWPEKGDRPGLFGIDNCPEMVDVAKDKAKGIMLYGDHKFDISSPEFNARTKELIDFGSFDAALCLGNTLCHISPSDYETVFKNIRDLLKEREALLIVEFRDGDKMKEWLENSEYYFNGERRCAYEKRTITQNAEKEMACSFFRYIWKDSFSYTSNGYFIRFSDHKDFCEDQPRSPATVQCVPTMEVAYVFPQLVRENMTSAGFNMLQISNYPSVLKHGIFQMGEI